MGLFEGRPQTSGLCRLNNCNNSERSSSRKFIKTSDAPYQLSGQRTFASTLGYKELYCGHFWLSLLSECLSCCLYVFIVCSTRISWTGAIIGHEPNLIAMSLSSGIAMMLLIFTFRSVHINPALTVSFLLTGRVPILRAILYLVAHCIGAVAAAAFLYSISIKGHAGALGLDNPHDTLNDWQILIIEAVISFVVTITTYATCNYSSYRSAKKIILEQLGQNGRSLLGSTFPEDANYDYEYDNHRIYATQKLKSESSSTQTPIEEVMQDECHFLAPNGFSLHVTTGQAFIIGLAYTLTSLTGIPASGASLNPARSFGPAFIMNIWEYHWIYWVGPILGAVIAGFFYEFIFNPTRESSLCYRPKLFRLNAHDIAKVGSKSRLYQQYQQKLSTPTIQPSTTVYRPQAYNRQPFHSPSTAGANNLISSSSLLKSSVLVPKTLPNPASVAHLQATSQYPNTGNTFNLMNYIHQQEQDHQLQQQFYQQQQQHQTDQSKPSAMINSIATTIHHHNPANQAQRINTDMALNLDHNRPMMGPSLAAAMAADRNQVVYDDPNLDSTGQRFNDLRMQQQHHQSPNVMSVMAATNTLAHNPNRRSMVTEYSHQANKAHDRFNHTMMLANKPNQIVRPHSMAFDHQRPLQVRQQYPIDAHGRPIPGKHKQLTNKEDQLDDELYNVLSGDDEEDCLQNSDLNHHQRGQRNHSRSISNSRSQSNEHDIDYANNDNNNITNGVETTSDSSQRTNELLSSSGQGDRSLINNHNNNSNINVVHSPLLQSSKIGHLQDSNNNNNNNNNNDDDDDDYYYN